MPYIHCPQCRLTVYGGIAYKENKRCPRCEAEMTQSPRPLFRSLGRDAGRPKAPPGGQPSQFAGGSH